MVGIFNLVIDDDNFKVLDSSLHFEVEPGLMYPSVCVVSWMGLTNKFEAGMNASILILPKYAFGNNISFSGKEMEFQGFSLSLLNENGSFASTLNITHIRWIESGYVSIEFVLVTAGKFLLLVEMESQTLNGVPLPLEVNPGPLDVPNCLSIWKSELNTWQIFSEMEIRGNRIALTDHICKEMNELNLIRCKKIPKSPGADWRNLPKEKVKLSNGLLEDLIPWCLLEAEKNEWKGLFGRLDWQENFLTSVTDPQPMGKVGMCFHPEQDRIVTVRECARSQGFPDSYEFAGNITDKHRQIGNAVPPPLAFALGRKLKEALLLKNSLQHQP